MRFKFCGDLDAPDWCLAEVATLSKMVRAAPPYPPPPLTRASQSSVRVKVLATQVLTRLCGGLLDYEKVGKLAGGAAGAAELSASVAALDFILSGAGRHSVDDATLAREMLQLGLPAGTPALARSPSPRAHARSQSTATRSANPTPRTEKSCAAAW